MLGRFQGILAEVATFFLAAVCMVASGQVEAAVRFVDPCWTDVALIPNSLDYGETAFASLTAAVDAAASGDCVVLNPGRYEEPTEQFPIVVDKAIAIRSARGNAETVLSGPPFAAVFEIKARGVEIEGLTIELKRYGVVVVADGVRIRGNRLRLAKPEYRQTSCGIWLAGARKAQVTGNEFISCGLGISGPPVSDASKDVPVLTGLFEVGEDPGFFTTHRIEDNLVDGRPLCYIVNAEGVSVPRDAGQVILAGCRDISLDGLQVSDTSIGIEVAYSDRVRLSNVTAANCGLFGIYLCYASGCEIANITCDGDTHGIDVRAAERILIRDCTVSNCGQGIFLSWVSNSLVSECTVQEGGVGVFVASGESNQIALSKIDGNELGVNVRDEQDLLLTENLISDSTTTGMRLHNTSSTLYGNSILENWVGLIASDSSGISMTTNRFYANEQCALYMTNLNRLKMALNQFEGNENVDVEVAGTLKNAFIVQNAFIGPQGMILNGMAESLDLSLNWWGTTDPEGIAGRCQGTVDFAPFLGTAP